MPDGQVVFEITADGKKAYAAINDVTNALKKAGKNWENTAETSGENMTKAFAKALDINRIKDWALKGGKALLDFGKDALQAASDLQEVQNVVDVTFGAGASQIESWAKSAATNFGLTELQAKRFTSTMGAMLKSSGLAGDQIIEMSTDLAGLAADMASFYNLDFDTAFQKIRSGIAGENEPLKTLGINLSVANLEAFALQQGLSKTFSEMSQGEQTLLRYQYLMQATSDAQGDFARTSGESFANMKRQVETNLETIKASIGNLLIRPISEATTFLNDFLLLLTPQEKKKTVLDEINDIESDKVAKLEQIKEISSTITSLLEEMEKLDTNNGVKPGSGVSEFISSFTANLEGLDSALANVDTTKINLTTLAEGLSVELGGDSTKWGNLLKAIKDNAKGAIEATQGDSAKTKEFLENVAAGADDLKTDYSIYWNKLLTVIGNDAAGAINALAGGDIAGTALGNIATGANKLTEGKQAIWSSLLTTLEKLDGLDNIFSASSGKNVEELAKALSNNSPDTTQAEAWAIFLGALQTNPEALATLTQTDATATAEWLSTMAEAANKIDPADADAWSKLLGSFVEGLPGLENTEFGSAFFEALRTNFLAMGNESDVAKAGLAALGYSTEDITTLQAEWLLMTKNLVKELPSLSSIINTQTGEIEGGTQAVADYIEEWSKAQEKQILLETIAKKRQALESRYSERWDKQVDVITAQAKAERLQKEYNDLLNSTPIEDRKHTNVNLNKAYIAMKDALDDLSDAQEEYNEYMHDYAEALALVNDEEQAVIDLYGEEAVEAVKAAQSTETLTESMTKLEQAATGDENAIKQYEEALKSAGDALQAVADYQEKVRSETESTVRSLVNGFGKIETPMQKTRREVVDLTKAINEAKTAEEKASLEKTKKNLEDSQISIHSMTEGLESQLKYMQEYRKMLDEARAKGVSEDILATLSDGSQESFDYLYALTQYGGDIDKLNDKYKEVQKEAETFTNTLTDQKLTADETYQTLVKQAQEAVNGLNLSDEAYTNTAATVIAISKAIGDKSAEVKTQVDNVIAQIARLNSVGLAWNGYGSVLSGTNILFKARYSSKKGSNANGIDNVPFDGYLALLHQGERVQTAAEADLARRYSYQQPAFDYNAMGGAIGANIGRGNVYLDGKTVGMVISDRQANSYRALERSGWQG